MAQPFDYAEHSNPAGRLKNDFQQHLALDAAFPAFFCIDWFRLGEDFYRLSRGIEAAADLSPVQRQRAWERQAEDNVMERLEKASLLAPDGEVSKVLETVANNLQITNNLNIQPEVRVRVLLTSQIESLTIGHSIVLSRGLVDTLPDEASLAMVVAHELAHIALGHRLDTKYAFSDRNVVRRPGELLPVRTRTQQN